MALERKGDLAKVVVRALMTGACVSFVNACVAGRCQLFCVEFSLLFAAFYSHAKVPILAYSPLPFEINSQTQMRNLGGDRRDCSRKSF